MRSIRIGAGLALLTLSVGCVTPERKLANDTAPVEGSGYVGVVGKKDTIARFGFGVRDETGHDRVVPLQTDLVLVQLPPGKYHVATWITFAALTNERITSKDIPSTEPLARTFELQAGQVMVLGNWNADRAGRLYWIVPQRMTLAGASSLVREKYPGFAGAPVACLTCQE